MKTIAEWIHRRGDAKKRDGLAHLDFAMWLTPVTVGSKRATCKPRRRPEGNLHPPSLRPEAAGTRNSRYIGRSRPSLTELEVVNAVTDLIE